MKKKITVNREYKDRLFCRLFGSKQYANHLVELYNALNDTNYTVDDIIEITTIDDAIYMEMKNDVSFLINSFMPLFEQQSTYNPNMAFREFEYCAKLYNKYVQKNHLDIYSTNRIMLPTPQCYVFYNGTAQRADTEVIRLSDSFFIPTDGYEWTTIMLNINAGHNQKLLSKCKMLDRYSKFNEAIRDYKKRSMPIEEAVDLAVKDFSIKGDPFGDFLISHRSEVLDMCITEYNKELHESTLREESREGGIAEARATDLKILITYLKEFIPDSETLYQKIIQNEAFRDITREEFQKYYS